MKGLFQLIFIFFISLSLTSVLFFPITIVSASPSTTSSSGGSSAGGDGGALAGFGQLIVSAISGILGLFVSGIASLFGGLGNIIQTVIQLISQLFQGGGSQGNDSSIGSNSSTDTATEGTSPSGNNSLNDSGNTKPEVSGRGYTLNNADHKTNTFGDLASLGLDSLVQDLLGGSSSSNSTGATTSGSNSKTSGSSGGGGNGNSSGSFLASSSGGSQGGSSNGSSQGSNNSNRTTTSSTGSSTNSTGSSGSNSNTQTTDSNSQSGTPTNPITLPNGQEFFADGSLNIPVGTTWQWQLEGNIDTSLPVQLYDIDLFDTTKSTINELKSQGRVVICYFSAGTWEPSRSDSSQFSEEIKGNEVDGFEEERWLDVANPQSFLPIMQARLDLAKQKGCDGVEPDNVDAYDNETGFNVDEHTQVDYNLWLAHEAHQRGLSIGLKNALDIAQTLEPFFNFAVNEQCHEYNECDKLKVFTESGKAVFGAEYTLSPSEFCPEANSNDFRFLKKNKDYAVDATFIPCWE